MGCYMILYTHTNTPTHTHTSGGLAAAGLSKRGSSFLAYIIISIVKATFTHTHTHTHTHTWQVCVCVCESSFSCLKRLKSYTRNTMGHGRLSSVALLAMRGHWSSHWKRQLVGHRAFPWKITESWIYVYDVGRKMSFPSLKDQQPQLLYTQFLISV